MLKLKLWTQLRGLKRREKLRLAWDIFMVWVALINLWMILFDLSYLWLRPIYYQYLPPVTRAYDPLKGIGENQLTEDLRRTILGTRDSLRKNIDSPGITSKVEELRLLSSRLLIERPFEKSGLEEELRISEDRLARAAGVSLHSLRTEPTALRRLWPADPQELRYRLDHLDPGFLKLLRINYSRDYGRGGRLIDHFWILDLPFLLLFWIEFIGRWIMAMRRHTHARWFFFPIFNWYDVLGLLPMAFFRPFRLLRLVSVYMRLRQSDLSVIGKDYLTRSVEYFSNILTEEVSDRVSLRILSEFEEEIQDGTHRRIAETVLKPRHSRINLLIAERLAAVFSSPRVLEDFRHLAHLNLDTAIEESESLAAIPLPQLVLRPLVRSIGDVFLETTVETLSSTLNSDEGREALEDLLLALELDLLSEGAIEEIESVVREISVEVIEKMKDVVAVKKWALPEAERPRPPAPWEKTD